MGNGSAANISGFAAALTSEHLVELPFYLSILWWLLNLYGLVNSCGNCLE